MPDDAMRTRADLCDADVARRRAVALITARLDCMTAHDVQTRPLLIPLLEETVSDAVLDPRALAVLLFELTSVASALIDTTATTLGEHPAHVLQAVALAMETS